MPVRGDTYVQRTKEEILAFLEAEMQAEYGEDIDLTESSAFSTFAEAISELDAQQLEPAIEEVFDAAYLETATGAALENLVALIGVQRTQAAHATGTIRFSADSRVDKSYTIPEGTTVQTDSETPVSFDTTEGVELTLFDDFESGSLSSQYAGDTGSFTVVDGSGTAPTPQQGSFLLESDGTTDAKIFTTDQSTHIGKKIELDMYTQNGFAGSFLFGVQDADNYYRVFVDNDANVLELYKSEDGSETQLTSLSASIPSQWATLEVEWLPDQNGRIIVSYTGDVSGTTNTIEVVNEDTFKVGGFGFQSGSADTYWDHVGTEYVIADARCIDSGTVGNVGDGLLTVTPTSISGVDSVTNRFAMGNSDRYLTDLTNFTTGLEAETDEELRDRAQVSEGTPGEGTVNAIIAALREVPGVESVTLFENDTLTDNTGSGGLPPVSFEAVVYGTHTDQDVAGALFESVGFTSRPYGGANGSQVTEQVTADNGQTFTMEWSEPTAVNVDMTLDLVVNDTYIGDDEIRDRIVAYIGGIDSDTASVLGTGVGEDVYINQLEDAIVGPDDTGVIGIDTSGTSYTPTTTTDANGLEIISVGSTEVAKTDASDGSITINKTTV